MWAVVSLPQTVHSILTESDVVRFTIHGNHYLQNIIFSNSIRTVTGLVKIKILFKIRDQSNFKNLFQDRNMRETILQSFEQIRFFF